MAARRMNLRVEKRSRHKSDTRCKTVVTNRLTGNFPGSPVNLEFVFRLEGNKIASLEIG